MSMLLQAHRLMCLTAAATRATCRQGLTQVVRPAIRPDGYLFVADTLSVQHQGMP